MTPGVECTSSTLKASLTKNDSKNVEGTITSATFSGPGSGGDCTSTFGDFNLSAGPHTNDVPWCLRSTEKMATDAFHIRGGACDQAARAIRLVTNLTSLGSECVYERASTAPVVGTFTTGGTQASLTISEQGFAKLSGAFVCPSELKFDMAFNLETENGAAVGIS